MRNLRLYLSLVIIASTVLGCKKFLDIENPRNVVVADYVFNSENSAIAAVTGLYFEIQGQAAQGPLAQGINGISISCGAAADELFVLNGSSPSEFYRNNGGSHFWTSLYETIYKCNAAIEGLEKSDKLSSTVKNQLLGETRFTRAFLYFYLVNFFGDVPLLTTTNYEQNSKAGRTDVAEVYEQIRIDLLSAIQLLNSNYVSSDVKTVALERVRPNKAAAQALLARTYLYIKDWVNAKNTASLVIDNPFYKISSDLDAVFLKNSNEAIWQLQPQTYEFGQLNLNTADARYFVLDGLPDPIFRPITLSEQLNGSFESGDNRYLKWVVKTAFEDNGILLPDQYRYPYKYKLNQPGQAQQEYVMVLRIAEQYLIRAEAKINSNDIAGGIADLNLLRSVRRADPTSLINNPLPALSLTLSLEQARLAVEHERQVELFCEWGHRWLDLKRTERLNLVMSNIQPLKGGVPWRDFKKLFPTPEEDRRLNENLGQTLGWPN